MIEELEERKRKECEMYNETNNEEHLFEIATLNMRIKSYETKDERLLGYTLLALNLVVPAIIVLTAIYALIK